MAGNTDIVWSMPYQRHALALHIEVDELFGWIGVALEVDGESLFPGWCGASVPIEDLLQAPSPLIDDLPHRVVLQLCTCAIVGCGSASAVISSDPSTVYWTDWQVSLPEDEAANGAPRNPQPLAFDREQYEVVVRAAVDRARPDLPATAPLASAGPEWNRIVRPGTPGEMLDDGGRS